MSMQTKTIFSKNFLFVVIGRVVSAFGSQILRYALPLYLLNQTGSAVLFGGVLAVSFLPMILFFPIGGIIADRVNKRNIMLAMDLGTAVLISIFCILASRVDMISLVTITMIILYGMDGIDRPAVKASVPALVKAELIMQANATIDVLDSAASMAGPVIGGFFFSIFGLMPILYISIVCFLASVILDLLIKIPFKKQETEKNIVATGISDLKTSLSFIFYEKPVLWKLSLLFAVSNLLLTPLIMIGLPVLITQHLGFEPSLASQLYGYAQGVIALGAVAGGVLAGMLANKLTPKTSYLFLIGCSFFVIVNGVALQFLHVSIAIYLILTVSCGMMLTMHTLFQIQVMTYLQLLVPAELIGKIISCFMCIVMGTIPIGQFLYGIVFSAIETDNRYLPFYFAGLLTILISFLNRRIFDLIPDMTADFKAG